MPRQQKDFVQNTPWKNLTVGAKAQKPCHQPNYIMCSVCETVNHVLSRCKFWPVAYDIVTKAFGPLWGPSRAMCPMKRLLIDEPLLSLQTTQGLALWDKAQAGWVLRCEAKLRGVSSSVSDFVPTLMHFIEAWTSAAQMSFVRQEGAHLCDCLSQFLQGQQMFPLVQPQGAVIRSKTVQVPKKEKWAFILREKMAVIEEKVQRGLDVAYVYGSINEEGGGVNFAGYGVWFGPGDTRNEQAPLPVHDKQSITMAKLTATL